VPVKQQGRVLEKPGGNKKKTVDLMVLAVNVFIVKQRLNINV
jgi:hypothetical protein